MQAGQIMSLGRLGERGAYVIMARPSSVSAFNIATITAATNPARVMQANQKMMFSMRLVMATNFLKVQGWGNCMYDPIRTHRCSSLLAISSSDHRKPYTSLPAQ